MAADRGDVDRLPASFAQERLWFIDQLEPGMPTYNVPAAVRLRGPVRADLLERAFAGVIARHETLRTTFDSDGGRPVQVVAREQPFRLEEVVAEGRTADERLAEAWRRAREEAHRPFDLARGPLVRSLLIQAAPDDRILVVTMHHIVSDGWSYAILFRELAELYSAAVEGRRPVLADLAIQYADYAAWQRSELTAALLARRIAPWRERLRGAAPIELPADRAHPVAATRRGATHAFTISMETAHRLDEIARRGHATLFAALVAPLSALLHRYGGPERIVMGTVLANRTRVEVEGLIGFFANTLPLAIDLSGDPPFIELVRRASEAVATAQDEQDLPFDKLVAEVAPARDASRNPLFSVLFVLNEASVVPRFSGVSGDVTFIETETSKFDLSIGIRRGADGLAGTIQFATDLFDAPTVARIARHFTSLLDEAAARPEAPISALSFLTAEERRVLAVANDTSRPPATSLEVHELFEEQARRRPDAVALESEAERISYAELNRRANRLARRLRKLGVGPDVLVAICMERSAETVVSVLAVLKAGGAYVPIDAEYPEERIAYILSDAGAKILLTQERVAASRAAGEARVVFVQPGGVSFEDESDANLEAHGAPEHLAFVIYTSGSTGRPKGAANTRRGLKNFLLWQHEAFGLGAEDVFLHKTPFGFDVAVWETLSPFIAGARLVLARPGGQRDPAYLRELIRSEGVTTVHFVPAMLRAFLEEPGLMAPPSVVRVFSGGEALTPELRRRFFDVFGSTPLHNRYGPAEASIDATSWTCTPRDDGAVPIGRPIANVTAHVLDRFLEVAPVGVKGELYLGGAGVGRGYLNRPDLTAERFVPSPFARGERLYRTGDLARRRADGALEYLGRIDHQVKIRGFRIELGEIEAVLREQGAIADALVVVREDVPDNKRLVAYVVARGGALDEDALRAACRAKLPDYMVPSAFVALERFPVGPNGKIDRASLPAPAATAEDRFVPPRSADEEKLAVIWREVLGIEAVSVEQSFFELGGHSLLATQVVSRIRRVFACDLSLARFFEAPTISGLATIIAASRAASSGEDRIGVAARKTRSGGAR